MSFTNHSLARRIIGAMTITVTVLSVLFLGVLAYSFHKTESTLVGEELKQTIIDVSEGRQVTGRGITLYASQFVREGIGLIPDKLASVEDGFSELLDEGDYFVYKYTKDGVVWIALQDQNGFESIEVQILSSVLVVAILAILLTLLLSYGIALKITSPLRHLTREVRNSGKTHQFKKVETPYVDDEIGILNQTLESCFDRINRALQREKAFTADVSHELRTPITVISTTAELLSIDKNLKPETKVHLESIVNACDRLKRLTHVFLALAREERSVDSNDVASVGEVAQYVCAIWKQHIEKKGVRFELDIQNANRLVSKTLSESLIDNLLRNATQYTADGFIAVTVNNEGIEVRDSGMGISDEEKDKVMEKFVRGKRAPGEGYGWGLSLISRICEHEGWKLSYEANQPKGSVFCIRFS